MARNRRPPVKIATSPASERPEMTAAKARETSSQTITPSAPHKQPEPKRTPSAKVSPSKATPEKITPREPTPTKPKLNKTGVETKTGQGKQETVAYSVRCPISLQTKITLEQLATSMGETVQYVTNAVAPDARERLRQRFENGAIDSNSNDMKRQLEGLRTNELAFTKVKISITPEQDAMLRKYVGNDPLGLKPIGPIVGAFLGLELDEAVKEKWPQ